MLPLLEASRNFSWFHQIREGWEDCACWVKWETERKSTSPMGYGVSFSSLPSCVNQRDPKASLLIPFPPLVLVSILISTTIRHSFLEKSPPPPFEMPTLNLGNHNFRCALLFLGGFFFFFKYCIASQQLFEMMSAFQGSQQVWKGVRPVQFSMHASYLRLSTSAPNSGRPLEMMTISVPIRLF